MVIENHYTQVLKVYEKVKNILPTLTANQYDYYKLDFMPVSKTIINRTKNTWNEILDILQLPRPLNRHILARVSNTLHILETKMKDVLGIGWNEKSFNINGRRFRPDSYFTERMALDGSFFVLDVKLCVSAAPITIYKYLPLFQNNFQPKGQNQVTFFENWLPNESTENPIFHYDNEGQASLSLKNKILYISYLVGKPKIDIFPCSNIRGKSSEKKKKTPSNMEVRYVNFFELPRLYCELAGIDYDEKKVTFLLEQAQQIKSVVLELSDNAESICSSIRKQIETNRNL